jgi:2-dehydropantoate 2-reductase
LKEIKTVALIGLGALGIMYAQKLSALLPDGDFSIIVDQERRERYEAQGIFCNGAQCRFRYVLPEEAKACDLLIFSTKATGLHAAMESAKCCVGENTVILSVINGIASEEILGERFGEEKMIYAIEQGTDATRVGNRLTYHLIGNIVIGEKDGTVSERIRAVEKLLLDADYQARLGEAIAQGAVEYQRLAASQSAGDVRPHGR